MRQATKYAGMDLNQAVNVFTKSLMWKITEGHPVDNEEIEALNSMRENAGMKPLNISIPSAGAAPAQKEQAPRSEEAPPREAPRKKTPRKPSHEEENRDSYAPAPIIINGKEFEGQMLPDNNQWTNRFYIKSESSGNLYTIAQNKARRYWGCSCPGWIGHRKCKHLKAMELPFHEQPYEARIKAASKTAVSKEKKLLQDAARLILRAQLDNAVGLYWTGGGLVGVHVDEAENHGDIKQIVAEAIADGHQPEQAHIGMKDTELVECLSCHEQLAPMDDEDYINASVIAKLDDAAHKWAAEIIHSDNDLASMMELAVPEVPGEGHIDGPEAGPSNDELHENAIHLNGPEGSPTFDGDLKHPERQNTNAIREALETQVEMEVGKPIDQKQDEVAAQEAVQDAALAQGAGGLAGSAPAAEGVQEVTAKPGTQVIINIGAKLAATMADRLMLLENKIWDRLGIDSGGQLMQDPQLEASYHAALDKALTKVPVVPQKVLDALTNENYHQLVKYLTKRQAKSASMKVAYVKHCPGHKNSKGESAEWCIYSHETGKIISSEKSEGAAKKQLQNMHAHSGATVEAEGIGGENQPGATAGNAGGMFGGTDLEGPSFKDDFKVGFTFRGTPREASFSSVKEAHAFIKSASAKFGKVAGNFVMKCPACQGEAKKTNHEDDYKCSCGWTSNSTQKNGGQKQASAKKANEVEMLEQSNNPVNSIIEAVFSQLLAENIASYDTHPDLMARAVSTLKTKIKKTRRGDTITYEVYVPELKKTFKLDNPSKLQAIDDFKQNPFKNASADPAKRNLVLEILKSGPKTTGELEKALGGGKYTNKAWPILNELSKEGLLKHKQMRWSLKASRKIAFGKKALSLETRINEGNNTDFFNQIVEKLNVIFATLKRIDPQGYMDSFEAQLPSRMMDIAQEMGLKMDHTPENDTYLFYDQAAAGTKNKSYEELTTPAEEPKQEGIGAEGGMSMASLKSASIRITSVEAMPRAGTPESAELKIAIQTLKMPEAIANVMGGPGVEHAHQTLARYGLRWDEAEYMAGGKGVKKASTAATYVEYDAGEGEYIVR